MQTLTQDGTTSIQTSTLLSTVTEGGQTITLPGETQAGTTVTSRETW